MIRLRTDIVVRDHKGKPTGRVYRRKKLGKYYAVQQSRPLMFGCGCRTADRTLGATMKIFGGSLSELTRAQANHALQRTAASRCGCNRRAFPFAELWRDKPWPPLLSLDVSLYEIEEITSVRIK